MSWKKAQEFEKDWHGDCINSFWEETKQQVYAQKMGLQPQMVNGKYPVYDLQGKSVLDMGGGSYSLLLKCINVKGVVVDPLPVPEWVKMRYKKAGIEFIQQPGELPIKGKFDETWIYNCCQHSRNPEKIIKNIRKASKLIRVFEWVEEPISPGHIHTLHEKELNRWLGGYGKVEKLNESGCVGLAYYGCFLGNSYEKI